MKAVGVAFVGPSIQVVAEVKNQLQHRLQTDAGSSLTHGIHDGVELLVDGDNAGSKVHSKEEGLRRLSRI